MKNKKVINILLIIVFISGLIVILFLLLKNIRGQNLSDSETADWQGKTTDWLGRTFDVNNPGKEFESKDLKIDSSTGWTIPNKPYTIDKGDLEKVEMSNEYSRKNNSIAKNTLNETDLSTSQKKYFYDNNYVPRSVEHFDVTGDGIAETVVTSLTLGCGRCVDFYMTIFSTEGKYNMRTTEGIIIKSENGNGFYLINIDYPSIGTTISISKYKWDKSLFTEVARKEIVTSQQNLSQLKPVTITWNTGRYE